MMLFSLSWRQREKNANNFRVFLHKSPFLTRPELSSSSNRPAHVSSFRHQQFDYWFWCLSSRLCIIAGKTCVKQWDNYLAESHKNTFYYPRKYANRRVKLISVANIFFIYLLLISPLTQINYTHTRFIELSGINKIFFSCVF